MSQKIRNYKLLGDFAPTFYRILDERAPEWKDEARTEALLTVEGKLIERVTPSFKQQLDIEGSARLRDGRIVNFHQKIDGSWRYLVALHAPFGLGIDGYKLIPYRTLAVDSEVIGPGLVLYIPALDGVRLPSGEIHDGFVFTHDEGQGITGKRIDVFVGFESDVDNTLTRSGRIEDMEPVEVYQVDDETAARLNRKYEKQFAR
ncbi:MAG TPA: 3D domain-containing protein [Pyrinomonadaceae bacterium]|nr:3D domain-containing protein [Pyrinomonadaceae bacterium]